VLWGNEWVVTARLDLEGVGRMAGKRGNALLNTSTSNGDGNPQNGEISKVSRKKRAREAREALEAISLSGSSDRFSTPLSSTGPGITPSSANDPDFVKVWGGGGRFKGVIGVGWLAVGEDEADLDLGMGDDKGSGDEEKKWELGIVERPWGDFVGELPAGFWEGRFGRS
jgi:U3 small nucleolar RNA-associated protein 4